MLKAATPVFFCDKKRCPQWTALILSAGLFKWALSSVTEVIKHLIKR